MTNSATHPRIGLLGTGAVGETLGTRLAQLGYQVFMGSRDPSNPKAAAWATRAGGGAGHGTFRQAAQFGEIVINATRGGASLDVLESAGAESIEGKVLIDAANPIDFTTGVLPFGSDSSLAERIQQAYPRTRVVKSLNTMNVSMMLGQESYPGNHDVFMSGNDPGAKQEVRRLLEDIGWGADHIIDLGGIEAARAQEHYLILFWRLRQVLGTPAFNIGVVRK